jgi:DNA-binding transcriptional ArsR family regulator
MMEMNAEIKALAKSQAAMCSVFANSKRVLILWSLVDQEKSVGDIAAAIGASLQCTSQHLGMMKKMGILESRRDGQTIYYRVVRDELEGRCKHVLRSQKNQK